MATKNLALVSLTGNKTYTDIVFNQVWLQVEAYRAANPQGKLFTMALGDTSQPLPQVVVRALVEAANRLGDSQTYTGYEDTVGNPRLREAICTHYYEQKIGVKIQPEEIFISDGAQSAVVNIQELFALDNVVAVQDPTYPAFIEGTLLANRPLVYLECTEANGFVPDVPREAVDIIYLCFPNNPTGVIATYEQLQGFVDYARSHQAVIIFDAVYSFFIHNSNIPRSIYEVEGAMECAIEIGSFSKWASFTGLRVGWCTIPETLMIHQTELGELNRLWKVSHGIKFWGPANVAQYGAIAALSTVGQAECQAIVDYYLENTRLMRGGLESIGLQCYGSPYSPFIWVKASQGLSSWEFFKELLESTGIVGVPGNVFGSNGEGFLRLSALCQRRIIEQAVESLASSTMKI